MSAIDPKEDIIQDFPPSECETKSLAQPELITTPTDDPTTEPIEMPDHKLMIWQQNIQERIQKIQTSIETLTEKQTSIETSIKGIQESVQKIQTSLETLTEEVTAKKQQTKRPKIKKPDFSAVTYLHENGEDALRGELEKQPNTELIRVSHSVGIQKMKNSKNINREEIIKEILLNAERRLKAWSVLIKDDKNITEIEKQ